MGGLGNARRGGRSPPLLIGALIACVLVLGFNYWVSSSRNLELQTRLFEMEGAVRRVAAERGTVEQKKKEFEEELHRQSEQITRMEARHKIQLETTLDNWKQEKTTLALTISSSTRAIQTLKAQLASLEEIQKELQDCQTNQTKLSTTMTECTVQMGVLKKECAAKTPYLEKSPPVRPPSQDNSGPSLSRTDQAEKPGQDDTKNPSVPALKTSWTDTGPEVPNAKLSALESNEITKAGDGQPPPSLTGRDLSKPERSIVSIATRKSDIPQQENPEDVAKQGEELEVMETHAEKLQAAGNGVDRVERGDEPGDQLNAAGSEAVKWVQLKGNAGKGEAAGHALPDLKDALAEYNGDNGNVGEFEADKQAELAKN
ncbi:hypothetical protein SKAU_G00016860 [Synaphobranchus kaupii]|uniref:Golgi membrane protein 1 n=1 Tax=Synaphobranchus kaupii TaxID=118154 RepID=A0A9Q1JCR0_SYNKA|nr:hypothetical protein SKAU_G00016860 [Synaphobranchus kaupii]